MKQQEIEEERNKENAKVYPRADLDIDVVVC